MKRIALILIASMVLAKPAVAALVIVDSSPRGATVKIDGEQVGKTPCRKVVPAGIHDIELSAPDWQTDKQTVEVGKKLLQHVVKLRPKTYPVDVLFEDLDQTGWFIGTKRLQLTDDGQFATTPATISLPKGKHLIRLMKEGYRDIGVVARVDGENRAMVEVDTKPRKGYSSLNRFKIATVVGLYVKEGGVQIRYKADGTFVKIKNGRSDEGGTWKFTTDGNGRTVVFAQFKDGWKFPERFADSTGDRLEGVWTLIRVPEK